MRHIGRKLFHLFGGLGLFSICLLLGREKSYPVYAVLFLVVLAADLARLHASGLNRFLFDRLSGVIRNNEKDRLSGVAPYVAGVGLSCYLYPPEIAATAVCFLAFGDVAATTVGEAYGRTRIRGKSLEGSAAFVAAGIAAGLVFLPAIGIHPDPALVVPGAIVAALIELFPLGNDNFSIPVFSGAAMTLMAASFGIV